MKRLLSWIVLVVCVGISAVLLNIVVSLGLYAAYKLYDSSRGIFWVIILLGGSFGLGIAYYFSLIAAQTCIKISQKICPSKKGLRYMVTASIIGLTFLMEFIATFIADLSGYDFARALVCSIFELIMCVVLFLLGKSLEY